MRVFDESRKLALLWAYSPSRFSTHRPSSRGRKNLPGVHQTRSTMEYGSDLTANSSARVDGEASPATWTMPALTKLGSVSAHRIQDRNAEIR